MWNEQAQTVTYFRRRSRRTRLRVLVAVGHRENQREPLDVTVAPLAWLFILLLGACILHRQDRDEVAWRVPGGEVFVAFIGTQHPDYTSTGGLHIIVHVSYLM